MTTAMAAPQDSIHERLQEEPLYLHHGTTWPEPSDPQDDPQEMSPYYNMPKRNKRKNFKPRCAPNATTFSDDSNPENDSGSVNGNDRTSPDHIEDEKDFKIGVKNFSLLKSGAVDLSRRLSTDSNENIEYQNRLADEKNSLNTFQHSYIHSLQGPENTVLNFQGLQNKAFCAKNPFAISQLIKTNSPPRRRNSESDDEKGQDINANERLEGQEEAPQNGDASANRILRDYAMNTMKELLGIYGLSSNEVADAITGQIRALEALQGKPFTQIPLSLKRRHDSGMDDGTDRSLRRSSSATEDEGSTNITPPKTPDNDIEAQRQRALQIINQQSMRLFRSQGNDEEGSSDDGEQTLDLSVSRDGDGQELSTTSSAGNSISEFDQQSVLMRKNLEDLANLQMQGFFQKQSPMDAEDSQERKLQASAWREMSSRSYLLRAGSVNGPLQSHRRNRRTRTAADRRFTAEDQRKCYWCGPLAEQVHRSERAPPCGTDELTPTSCDEGYTHCATVATSPPYVESRLCVKFYQDECYSLYCNSTQTWRMVCPCRGDLCNGHNSEREVNAFSTLTRIVKKSKPRNRRSSSSGFINIRARTPRNNTSNMTNEFNDTNGIESPTKLNAESLMEIPIHNTTMPPIDLKQYNQETIIEHGSTVSVAHENNKIEVEMTTVAPISVGIEHNDVHVTVTIKETEKVEVTTPPMKITTVKTEEEQTVVQNEITKDNMPPAEALQQNVTPTKAVEMMTTKTIEVNTVTNSMVETTTEAAKPTNTTKKNSAGNNIGHLWMVITGFLMHLYL